MAKQKYVFDTIPGMGVISAPDNGAAAVVVAENMQSGDSGARYSSVDSLRDAYPNWRRECDKAGVRS